MTLPYYPFYWGDYSAKTFNLTKGQHGAYMLLLRHIYCTGQPIPHKHRLSIALARLAEDEADIDFVLETYFTRKGDDWFNLRAKEIMEEQHARHQNLVMAGKKGGQASPKQRLSPAQASLKQPYKQPEPYPNKKERKLFLEGKKGDEGPTMEGKVFVSETSSAFKAWEKHLGKSQPSVTFRIDGRLVKGWHFPSERPPAKAEERAA